MPKMPELLATGWRYHQAGDLPRAEEAYRRLVEQEPGNAQGWYLLGALCQARGDLAAALAHLGEALRLRPAFAEALNQRGAVLAQQGRPAEAVEHFRQALRQQPDQAEMQTNLALALLQQGRHAQAVALLQSVLAKQPEHARARQYLPAALAQQAARGLPSSEAYYQLGTVLAGQRHLEEAGACFQQALRLRPGWAEAHNSLGKVFRDQKRPTEAEACYREALRLQPDFAEAHYNLGVCLLEQRRPAEAEESCRAAIRLLPEAAAAHNTLGVCLLDQQRPEEALACFERAAQLQPGSVEAQNNRGSALGQLGRLEEALASYAQALEVQPDHAEIHWNMSLIQLLQGDFDKGWAEYEWVWRRPYVSPRVFTQPRWDGSPVAGRTILLYADHGLGDTIQFIRYARLAKEQGATVIVECQKPLRRLLARCPGIDQLVARGDPLPPFELQVPLPGLPHRFRTSLDTIPAQVPYLWADPALVELWRRELAAQPGFKIGIAWQGSALGDRQQRSIPLAAFAPLAALPGVQLISLQKDRGSEQVEAVVGRWPLTDLSARLDETAGPFMDTAAVMMNLDLVVTTDTSIPHLAGALGVPVWVALPKVACWRWLLEREDCPWYPTMRLFRQERRGDWGGVFERIAQAVQRRRSSEPEA
jgi:tetratricopeptide (TPR) repeat protein